MVSYEDLEGCHTILTGLDILLNFLVSLFCIDAFDAMASFLDRPEYEEYYLGTTETVREKGSDVTDCDSLDNAEQAVKFTELNTVLVMFFAVVQVIVILTFKIIDEVLSLVYFIKKKSKGGLGIKKAKDKLDLLGKILELSLLPLAYPAVSIFYNECLEYSEQQTLSSNIYYAGMAGFFTILISPCIILCLYKFKDKEMPCEGLFGIIMIILILCIFVYIFLVFALGFATMTTLQIVFLVVELVGFIKSAIFTGIDAKKSQFSQVNQEIKTYCEYFSDYNL